MVCRHEIGTDNGETEQVSSKPSPTSVDFPLGLRKFDVGMITNVSILHTPYSIDNSLRFERKISSLSAKLLKYITVQNPNLIKHTES
jgi:hypothetical protein